MNEETNERLWTSFHEAHETHLHILKEMKENGINEDYDKLEKEENNLYQIIIKELSKMDNYLSVSVDLREKSKEIYEYERNLYIKYSVLYIITIVAIKLFDKYINTEELADVAKYLIGLFLGSVYVGLLSTDINQNRNNSKERRNIINKLKTLREEYKEIHDKAVDEINSIYIKNEMFWDKVERQKVKNK